MTAISNFTQAMKELTGFDDDHPQEKSTDQIGRSGGEPDGSKQIWAASERPQLHIPDIDSETGSQITPTMTVNGQIEGSDSLKVDGKVAGDISVSASITINGKVAGDIQANNMILSGAVKGNIKANSDIRMNHTSVIVGDITAKNLAVQGKVKGNLNVAATTEIADSAVVVGDIVTGDIVSDKGCAISGNITTKDTDSFEFSEDKLFSVEGPDGR